MIQICVRNLTVLLALVFAIPSEAAIQELRWTKSEESNAKLENVIKKINVNLGTQLTTSNYILLEDRELATSRFKMYVQAAAGIPVRSASIRTWTDKTNNQAIQIEAFVENQSPIPEGRFNDKSGDVILGSLVPALARKQVMDVVRKIVKQDTNDTIKFARSKPMIFGKMDNWSVS
jgi:hypothetical protein